MPSERCKLQIAETRPWFEKARVDLQSAEKLLEDGSALTASAVFHCQQAAEKALKGFLSWHERPFGRTHDLARLGRECVTLDGTLESVCRRGDILTVYAWRFRYPGEPEEPTVEEARAAVALAREVYDAALARLPEEAQGSVRGGP